MSYSNLQLTLPGKSYNSIVGPDWRGPVLDMAPGGAPAATHEVLIPIPAHKEGRSIVPRAGATCAVTLGAAVTKGPTSYRPLTVTDKDGTHVYNLDVNGDLLPHLIPTDTNGHQAWWQPGWPRCRVGDITVFTFTP